MKNKTMQMQIKEQSDNLYGIYLTAYSNQMSTSFSIFPCDDVDLCLVLTAQALGQRAAHANFALYSKAQLTAKMTEMHS